MMQGTLGCMRNEDGEKHEIGTFVPPNVPCRTPNDALRKEKREKKNIACCIGGLIVGVCLLTVEWLPEKVELVECSQTV